MFIAFVTWKLGAIYMSGSAKVVKLWHIHVEDYHTVIKHPNDTKWHGEMCVG